MTLSRRTLLQGTVLAGMLAAAGCAQESPSTPSASPVIEPPPIPSTTPTSTPSPTASPSAAPSFDVIAQELGHRRPQDFGMTLPGIATKTRSQAVCLTFDACGGPGGTGFDEALIEALRSATVPATLFVNDRWVRANLDLTRQLAADPLFAIENHGTSHQPLTVNGRAAYGIAGTESLKAAYDEVMGCQKHLTKITGKAPRFFRSGTAHYDDVGVALIRRLGLIPAGFDVNIDGGATFGYDGVVAAMSTLTPGSIGIGHFNRPASATAAGVKASLATLKKRGITFARMSDVTVR